MIDWLMNGDDRKLICRLFAVATCIASEADELATAGQSQRRRRGEYLRLAIHVGQSATDLVAVAASIQAALALMEREGAKRRKRFSRT
jgi:hypothetical protein